MQKFGAHLGGTKHQTWIYTSLHLGWCHNGPYSWGRTLSCLFGCIHFIKKRNSGYVSGRVFPGSHVDSCWEPFSFPSWWSVNQWEASLNFFLEDYICCYKGVGVGGVQFFFYTPNLFFGVFGDDDSSLGWFCMLVFPMFWPSRQTCLARDTSCSPLPFFWFRTSKRSDSFIVGLQIGSVEYFQREKTSTE